MPGGLGYPRTTSPFRPASPSPHAGPSYQQPAAAGPYGGTVAPWGTSAPPSGPDPGLGYWLEGPGHAASAYRDPARGPSGPASSRAAPKLPARLRHPPSRPASAAAPSLADVGPTGTVARVRPSRRARGRVSGAVRALGRRALGRVHVAAPPRFQPAARRPRRARGRGGPEERGVRGLHSGPARAVRWRGTSARARASTDLVLPAGSPAIDRRARQDQASKFTLWSPHSSMTIEMLEMLLGAGCDPGAETDISVQLAPALVRSAPELLENSVDSYGKIPLD
jgi:hypothetical protein